MSHGERRVWKKMRMAPWKASMWFCMSVRVCELQASSIERSGSWARDQVAIFSPSILQVSFREEGRGMLREA